VLPFHQATRVPSHRFTAKSRSSSLAE
jgi:hypothetical protein